MFKKLLMMTAALGVAAAAAMPAEAAQCTNDVWKKVMERGKIIIGVKADYKPWGFRSESGDIVGMEADMAQGRGRCDGRRA